MSCPLMGNPYDVAVPDPPGKVLYPGCYEEYSLAGSFAPLAGTMAHSESGDSFLANGTNDAVFFQ